MIVTPWNCCDDSPETLSPTSRVCQPDLPPEFCRYEDEGCRYADSCLNCPYTTCLEEIPSRDPSVIRYLQQAAMLEAYRQGASRQAIARRFRVSYRTVLRMVAHFQSPAGKDTSPAEKTTPKKKGE